ncbi:MAG TPA: hypothetical protein VJ304_12225 [Flavobacterium sp.]|jgi:hypothetical protein|uniref:hypothetical protein n=1 Tax=Chryseobacterium sp. TaxID=1871047 RepID=UPI00261964CD|nr:hypothetical protein [Chryseobacterium sp.]MDF2553096.1 hypothetical protein [Chryseobacterium sp.]MDF2932220.1 hypothetical protein [Chryseobacterium sp.]HJY13547.1 hypothetical protein [Flavobacterium sp.]
MEITVKDIQSNLETLPKEFLNEVNDFIDFLKYKHFKEREYEVPEWQKNEVRRRMDYAQNNPQSFVSESEMNNYLNDLESGD